MKRIVVNGTFDLLHPGHVALLNHARGLGDHLTVAIDADQRVRELKGASRPVNNQKTRKFMLENLKSVDQVKIFYSDQELVDIVRNCSIMVKGSDYRGQTIVGSDVIDQIVFFERLDDYSTTKTIQHIADRR
jgi:D-beta-D-heptose 7-phosphate kinase/D-beta-D-heptose 1-phosphate adenosyltransferase